MFDRMDLGSVHDRLKVRTGHTDIEGRNMAVSGNVPSGNINTGNQFQMIDSEACDLFHNQIHPFVSFAVCCWTQVGIFRTENSAQYRGRCRLTVSTFIIKGIPCGYKMKFVNCQYLFSSSAPSIVNLFLSHFLICTIIMGNGIFELKYIP